MKTKMTIFASLLLAGFVFTGCNDDDDDNYTPDEKIVNALHQKYPNAQRVEWEMKNNYYVADLRDNNVEKEAWITSTGEWVMTESDILSINDLPEAVKNAFNQTEYKDWKVEDIDMLERFEMETMYVIEVEKGKQEFDLSYAEDGTLIKIVEDTDNNNNYQPTTVPEVLENFINENYSGAKIIDIEIEKGMTEIDILHDNRAKEVYFNNANEWLHTTWDISTREPEIQDIKTKVENAYSGYRTDDIDYIENADGSKYYFFELEKGDQEKIVKVDMAGNIIEEIKGNF